MPAKALLDSANPVDEFLLVEFNRRPMLSVAFSCGHSSRQARLRLEVKREWTG